MTTRPLAHLADQIAAALRRDLPSVRDFSADHDSVNTMSRESLRSECDLASGSELDAAQLDILTDMVAQRLRDPSRKGKRK
jgi:hypothetical protein